MGSQIVRFVCGTAAVWVGILVCAFAFALALGMFFPVLLQMANMPLESLVLSLLIAGALASQQTGGGGCGAGAGGRGWDSRRRGGRRG